MATTHSNERTRAEPRDFAEISAEANKAAPKDTERHTWHRSNSLTFLPSLTSHHLYPGSLASKWLSETMWKCILKLVALPSSCSPYQVRMTRLDLEANLKRNDATNVSFETAKHHQRPFWNPTTNPILSNFDLQFWLLLLPLMKKKKPACCCWCCCWWLRLLLLLLPSNLCSCTVSNATCNLLYSCTVSNTASAAAAGGGGGAGAGVGCCCCCCCCLLLLLLSKEAAAPTGCWLLPAGCLLLASCLLTGSCWLLAAGCGCYCSCCCRPLFRNTAETAKHHLISCRKWRKISRNNRFPGGRNVPSEILLEL